MSNTSPFWTEADVATYLQQQRLHQDIPSRVRTTPLTPREARFRALTSSPLSDIASLPCPEPSPLDCEP